MDIRYAERTPTLEEYKALRDAVDWNLAKKGISDQRAQDSLNASPLCVCAYEGDTIVGMVRVSGDVSMYGYIQDTIVLPTHKNRGIGSGLMRVLLRSLADKPGFLLGVCPSKVSVTFYEKLGFRKRPEMPNGFMSIEFPQRTGKS